MMRGALRGVHVEKPRQLRGSGELHCELRVQQLPYLHILVGVVAHTCPAWLALPRRREVLAAACQHYNGAPTGGDL